MTGSSVLKDRLIIIGFVAALFAVALIGTVCFSISRFNYIENQKQEAMVEAQKYCDECNRLKSELNNSSETTTVTDNWYESITPIQGNYNIRMGTLGGDFWWNDIDSYRGWRLQKKWFTGHCRILDPASYRCAWGGEEKMRESFNDVKRQIDNLR